MPYRLTEVVLCPLMLATHDMPLQQPTKFKGLAVCVGLCPFIICAVQEALSKLCALLSERQHVPSKAEGTLMLQRETNTHAPFGRSLSKLSDSERRSISDWLFVMRAHLRVRKEFRPGSRGICRHKPEVALTYLPMGIYPIVGNESRRYVVLLVR